MPAAMRPPLEARERVWSSRMSGLEEETGARLWVTPSSIT